MEDVYWWQYVGGILVAILYLVVTVTVFVSIPAAAGVWTGWRVLRKNLSPQQREFKAPVWVQIAGIVLAVGLIGLPLFTLDEWRVPVLGFLGIAADPYLVGPAEIALLALALFTSGLAYCCVSVWLYKLYFKFIQKGGNEQQGDPTPAQ